MEERALLGIVLFPLLSAVAIGVVGNRASRTTVHFLACGSVAFSFLLALSSFVNLWRLHEGPDGANVTLAYTAYEWFSLQLGGNTVPVQVRFAMDALSGVMTLVVTGIGLLIHIYSVGYMSHEKSYARFFSYLNLFTASMLILVLGSNLPLMFVGWEGVGLCSYLLIGFWWENPDYAKAGRKAFIANRIGDFGVLIGIFLLVSAVGSFEFADINAAASSLTRPLVLGGVTVGAVSIATAATLFLFLGCTGKSAQIPLYVWLPDAMAGPTPVSALIHAATMVTSGLYLVCRLSPVFALSSTTMAVIAVIGALTALLAATIGCVQNEIKKVLAYSTVSQLGFMFAAAGCGAFAASFFHVYTHAFFKACLFLGAGSVMHAVGAHGDADIRKLGGLRRIMPRTHATFLVSCLAIAGVPLFSGFFSKDEILVGALSVGDYFAFPGLGGMVFGVLVLAATMTAFYMFRLYFLTFSGEYRGGPDHGHAEEKAEEKKEAEGEDEAHAHGPHESPDVMTVPLIILGAGAVFGGYVWVGAAHLLHIDWAFWVHWLEPSLGAIGGAHEHSTGVLLTAMIVGTSAAVAGIGLAWMWYAQPGVTTPKRLAEQFPGLHALVFDKWRVDELYDATILRLSRAIAVVSAGVDKAFVDGVLAHVSAFAVKLVGLGFSRMQTGLVHAYGAAVIAGVLLLGWWFIYPHPSVESLASEGHEVDLGTDEGLGYSYRWDFDSDGTFDTEWSEQNAAKHTYDDAQLRDDVAVVIFEPARYGATQRFAYVTEGQRWHVDPSELGAWARDVDAMPPRIEGAAGGKLRIVPNGALVRRRGSTLKPDQAIEVARGETVHIGQGRLTVTGLAEATVRVRNAFGVEREDTLALHIPSVGDRPAVEVIRSGTVGGGGDEQ